MDSNLSHLCSIYPSMRKLFFIVVLLSLAACSKDKELPMCDSPTCQDYLQVWKNLMMERNGMTEEWMDDHLTINGTSIVNTSSCEFYRVEYTVQIDWAEVKSMDNLCIRIDPNQTLYPALTVARGPYLTQAEVAQVIHNRAFSSSMARIAPVEKLRYPTKAKAMRALEDGTGHSLQDEYVRLPHSTYFFPSNGHFLLYASGSLPIGDNRCVTGMMDLVSGYVTANEGPCWID
jgi:hypothetical protein